MHEKLNGFVVPKDFACSYELHGSRTVIWTLYTPRQAVLVCVKFVCPDAATFTHDCVSCFCFVLHSR